MSRDGSRLFVADQNADAVRAIDTVTMQMIGKPMPTGDAPTQMALSPDGRQIFVTNMYSGDVSVIDADHLITTGTSGKVGRAPSGIALFGSCCD